MASSVDLIMQEMLPELEDFEKRGVFTKSELHNIVTRRRNFEYQLHRRAALKQDFLRALDYEKKLDELRRHRQKTLKLPKTGTGKKGLADVAIIRRIHFIFDRATRKYKSDVRLWLRWLEFCRESRSHKQFSRVITKAIHRHATVSALWIEAAAWEFGQNANVAAARTLMQQGLRMCKGDEQMWVEYFRLELLYVQKLRARRKVLGISDAGPYDALVNTATVGTGAASEPSTSAAEPNQATAATAAVLSGGVACVVLRSALTALPTSLDFRRMLLGVLQLFHYSGVKQMQQMVYDSLASETFAKNEEAWDLRARRHAPAPPAPGVALDLARHRQVSAAYEAAFAALPTPTMLSFYVSYLIECIEPVLGHQQPPATDNEQNAQLVNESAASALLESGVQLGAELLALLQRAHTSSVRSEMLYETWMAWAERLGQQKLALKAARLACKALPSSAQLWSMRLDCELRLRHAGGAQPAILCALVREAAAAVPPAQQEGIWRQALTALPLDAGAELVQLCGVLAERLVAAQKGPAMGGMGAVAGAYLEALRSLECHNAGPSRVSPNLALPAADAIGAVWKPSPVQSSPVQSSGRGGPPSSNQGLEAARSFYKCVLHAPPPGGDFYRSAILIEKRAAEARQQAEAGVSKPGTSGAAVVALYEAALAVYGDVDTSLWLDYAEYQAKRGHGAGAIYSRAIKALHNPEEFVTTYRQRLGHASASRS